RAKTFGPFAIERTGRLDRFLLHDRELRPARIVRQRLALLGDEPLEFPDAEFVDEKLDARAGAILLFAEPSEHASDGLRRRQEFLDRQEFRQHFRLIRHSAKAAAYENFETALAVLDF